jgi:uncharacterized protein (TIGR02246 family)
MSPQEVEIRQLVAAAQAHQFDVAGLMALHDDEAVVINMVGRRVFGKPAFEAVMQQALSSALRQVPTTTEIDRVRFLTPDCALVSCTKTVHDQRAQAEAQPLPGRVGLMTYVVVRRDQGWVIASAQTTPLAT